MPENNELANMLRTIIQEEMQSVRQEVRSIIQEELKLVNEKLNAIEATVNDIRANNRKTHKEIFSRLDAMWDDIKIIERRVDRQEEKAVR